MKPEVLIIKNAGPFISETIDFTELAPLFLVYGNTGAGKTSLFDAMTFALYGTLNGSRKNKTLDFRSHFSQPQDQAFCELTFSSAGNRYRVHRTMPQSYTKRDGTIGTRQSEATLEQFDETTNQFVPVTDGKNQISDRIVSIIGLDAAEFSQIILLPQGLFAEFLRENSNDRRETLAKLFPVESFSGITAAVKEHTTALGQELKIIESQIQSAAKQFNPDTAEHDLSVLSMQRKTDGDARIKLRDQMQDIVSQLQYIETQIEVAKKDEINRQQLAALRQQEAEITADEQLLRDDESAQKFAVPIAALSDAEKTLDTSGQLYKAADSDRQKAEHQFEKLEAESAAMNEKKQSAAEGAVTLEKKRSAYKQAIAIERSEQNESQKKQEYAAAKKKHTDAVSESDRLLSALRALAGSPETAEPLTPAAVISILSQKRADAQQQLASATEKNEKAQQYENLCKQRNKAEAALADAKAAYSRAQLHAENTQKSLDDLETRRRLQEQNNAACSLVVLLKDGAPCPVCGSPVHPAPVVRLTESLSLADKIETEKINVSSAQHETQERAQNAASAKTVFETVCKAIAEMENGGTIPRPPAETARELADSAAQFKSCSTDCTAAAALAAQFARASDTEAAAAQRVHETEVTAAEAAAETASLRQTAHDAGIADTSAESISAEIAQLSERITSDTAAYERWNEAHTAAAQELTAARTRSAELKRQCEEREQTRTKAAQKLEELLSSSSFSSADAVRSALLSDKDRSVKKERVQKWHSETEQLSALIKNAGPAEKNDELIKKGSSLQHDLQAAKDKQDELDERLRSEDTELSALQKNTNEYARLEKQRSEKEKAYAPYAQLYNDLSGNNPKKTAFESWALSLYFAQIVDYASRRFSDISDGRYTFSLASDTGSGKGYRGLDLLVADSFTGTERDPATLSGGETFMASISLALALTDLVQNRNGGVRLDSLFIDEGFGTLDNNSLDSALSILQSLQETKMVGIISHVENLRTVIPSQIEVIKTTKGSHIRIQK